MRPRTGSNKSQCPSLRMLKLNNVLRIIFGLQSEGVAGGRRILLKVGLHGLHKHYCGDKIKDDEVGWECITYGPENII